MTQKKASTSERPVWFITGCSTGFGREIATQAIARGYRVVVTARNATDLKDFTQENAFVLGLDVTNAQQIDAAVKAAEARFGHIDVLVNNAGMAYFSSVEEGEDSRIRRVFEVNVFGLNRVIQTVLPGMRARHQGFIVNFSSIGGLRAFPALGYYNASKFAVEGLSEALWQEVEPLGLKVMLVEPSGFRTDWAGRSASESKNHIDDYAPTVGVNLTQLRASSGKQPGDPIRAATAILNAVTSKNPPHHLLLGNDAYDSATAKLEALGKEFSAWEAVSRAADFQ